ncbi:MAG: CoA transferase [bacterium]|nr:CoA transferase [Deltaproteobacteria bacterium]MCP4907744.1 CoA transferase [bacterium]
MRLNEIVNGDRGHLRPLEGIRVLSLEQMQALPYATQLMGHLGADIVKIEHPDTGDSGRAAMPAIEERDGLRVGATFLRNNLSKRSIAIDLKAEAGRDLVRRLVPGFDVVCENFTPGTTERLGLDYERLSRLHPALVHCAVSGFGQLDETPYRGFPAYAPIVEAMSGLYEPTRKSDQPPEIVTAGALGDNAAALFAVIGILAALRHRDQTGVGQRVDIAMYDSMIALTDMVPFLASMDAPPEWATSGSQGANDAFRASDGYFVVTVLRRHHFERLARFLGHEEWLSDPDFEGLQAMARQTKGPIRAAIEAWAADKTKIEAARALAAEGIAAGASQVAADLEVDPHVAARHMLIEVDRPDADAPIRLVGNPVKFSRAPEGPIKPLPLLGEHTAEVLREELGLSDLEIESLAGAGILRLGGPARD